MKHLIASVEEIDSETSQPLFWCNDQGWTDAQFAQQWDSSEIESLNLPDTGVWVTADEASYYLNDRQTSGAPVKPCKCKTTECKVNA